MAKNPTLSGKKPATKVEGHEIQQPRRLDAEHEREVTAKIDAAAETGEAPKRKR